MRHQVGNFKRLGVTIVHLSDGKMLVSGSRDKSLKLWASEGDANFAVQSETVAHSAAVTGVKFFAKSLSIASCSEDKTVKVWDLEEGSKFKCRWSGFDHEKCVNGIAIAPNDKLVASAGADKVVYLYRAKDGAKIGAFEGHKKGVWTAEFSPTAQILATGSADG